MTAIYHERRLENIEQLTRTELAELLTARGELQQQLFQQARAVRQAQGMDEVRVRGVIEISNFCRKNCDYCGMRASNQGLERYRLSADEILEIAAGIYETRIISTIFLQGGQDPVGDRTLEEVIPEIKRRYNNLNVLLNLGERPREVYQRFAELGANSYILKFETSDPVLYKQIAYTPLERRLQCLHWLREAGLKIGTGNIVGLPKQTLETLLDDLLLVFRLKPDFASSSPFIPNQDTPLETLSFGNLDLTLNTMALYRLVLPAALIPSVSALEKIQKGGQVMGLNAGANVITINFTPDVYKKKFVIYSKQRFVVSLEHAVQTIQRAGLQVRQPAIAHKI